MDCNQNELYAKTYNAKGCITENYYFNEQQINLIFINKVIIPKVKAN